MNGRRKSEKHARGKVVAPRRKRGNALAASRSPDVGGNAGDFNKTTEEIKKSGGAER